ncbi:MAG: protein kinase, partial [Ideonella sp.]
MEAATWRHLKSILEQALERADDDRRDYVAQACIDSPYLRARVNSLLDEADAPTNNFLEFPAKFPNISSYKEPAWVGKKVGPFRVVRRIALGGMGQVFFAEHEDSRRRQTVVIKAMRGDVDSQAMRRRFEQERWIHAQIDHPFIVRMVERGTIEGQPCIVLEHVDGLPIDAHCRIHRLSLRDRIS